MKPANAEVARKVQQWLAYAEEGLRFVEHGSSLSDSPFCP